MNRVNDIALLDYFGLKPWELAKMTTQFYNDLFVYMDIKTFLERKNNKIKQ